MGFLSRFEGKMEDTFEGAADRMANAPISPVQIAKKAEKQMRREKMVGAGKQYAPTLYTVLVNPDDDQRLFGYYPTLAGETETYLAAKAADEGLVMDGQPLVRFIVDDGLKHGKFDVIAEPVAAPIIAQLRAEEMQRYGIGGGQAPAGYGAPAPAPGYGAAPAQPYGYGQPAPAAPAGGYSAPAPAYQHPQPYQDIDAGFDEFGAQNAYGDFDPNGKPPLPYVPDDEIDYSIDYGEYTFDSQDFDDYRQNGRSQGAPVSGAAAAAAPVAMGAAAAGMAGAAAAAAPYGAQPGAAVPAGAPVAADTVVFAGGAAQASPVPNQAAVRASLIDTTNNRTYSLASARLLMGRESKNDIVVHDINASRTHAELRFEPQGVWTITDLGSTNGTLVNGAEIATHPLREGDRITIGMTNFVFTQAQ
ncbi:FhaA domain-containing protein [Gordonibacter pamelaeae]|uniref:FhaA domain-containing protein n=1 Tax=Gordonibacter pamelaeae TaxID=471189 RepID=UPI003A945DD0